jgi:hypothetical protein
MYITPKVLVLNVIRRCKRAYHITVGVTTYMFRILESVLILKVGTPTDTNASDNPIDA